MKRIIALFLIALTVAAPALAQRTEEVNAAAEAKASVGQLQQRLVNASRAERETADQLRALRTRVRELEKEQAQVAGELKASRQTLAQLLVALSRLSRLPPEVGILRQEKTRDAALSSILLGSTLPAVRGDAERLATSLHDLDRVQTELEKQRDTLASARKQQREERADIEGMLAERRKQNALSRQETAELNTKLETLKRDTETVDDLIRKVATPRAPDKPVPLLSLRGGYLQPVSGTLRTKFGERGEAGITSEGLTFKADGQSRIVAPAKGRVMYAGTFKGYGQIVIIEHDADMHSMIGGFGRIDVTIGQVVVRGEPLGLVDGDADDTHSVYYELRRRGKPIDPKPRNS